MCKIVTCVKGLTILMFVVNTLSSDSSYDIIHLSILNLHALKRTSMYEKLFRELSVGARRQGNHTELISKQLAETVEVGGAGA